MVEKVKWLYWLKWFLIMCTTLVVSYAITVFIIFAILFEDVEHNANEVCNQFSLGDSWGKVISISDQNDSKPYLDEKNSIVSFFFDGGFLDIAGCELYFENNILTKKKIWVD